LASHRRLTSVGTTFSSYRPALGDASAYQSLCDNL
jgi:hypothetical protein